MDCPRCTSSHCDTNVSSTRPVTREMIVAVRRSSSATWPVVSSVAGRSTSRTGTMLSPGTSWSSSSTSALLSSLTMRASSGGDGAASPGCVAFEQEATATAMSSIAAASMMRSGNFDMSSLRQRPPDGLLERDPLSEKLIRLLEVRDARAVPLLQGARERREVDVPTLVGDQRDVHPLPRKRYERVAVEHGRPVGQVRLAVDIGHERGGL